MTLRHYNCKQLLTVLYLIVFSGQAISQDSPSAKQSKVTAIEIDPRQYVSVLYNRFRTRERFDTVWNWEDRKGVPRQKVNTLDINGKLEILFDKLNLIKNTDFFGNISLEAEISGPKGTRPIEVSPFSMIGVNRKTIGIKSDPPSDVARKLLSLFTELSDAEDIKKALDMVAYDYSIKTLSDEFGRVIDSLIKSTATNTEDVRLQYSAAYNRLSAQIVLDDEARPDSVFKKANLSNLPHIFRDIKIKILDRIVAAYRKDFYDKYISALEYNQDKLPLIINYLNSFERSGPDGLKALLSLTNIDVVKYEELKSSLTLIRDTLTRINSSVLNRNEIAKDSILLQFRDPIYKGIKSLTYLSRLRGSTIEKIIVGFNQTIDNVSTKELLTRSRDSVFYRTSLLTIIYTYFDKLSELIAQKAGEQIYKKLLFASVDMGKNGAADGETLSLFVTWILDSSDSLGNSPRLEIGKFALRETGWKTEVTDMFSLVNRLHAKSSIDTAHESPSVFKGSGGAVFMWSYQKEDKGLNVHTSKYSIHENTLYYTKRKNVLMNFFQPSIGFNVSYLDFNTAKDVEIGTGIQLGLFRNKIYFGYGLNLHLLSPRDAPAYFFIGFSFAKISDLFKDAGKISAGD